MRPFFSGYGKTSLHILCYTFCEIKKSRIFAAEKISGSSLSVYFKTYAPHFRIRYSMLNLQYNEGLLSCPAPMAGWLDKWMPIIKQDVSSG